MHDAIARAVYGGVRGAAKLAGLGGDALLARRGVLEGQRLSTHPRASLGLAVLGGLRGDALESERSELVEPMSVRVDGEVVTPRRPLLAQTFPEATGRVVVFVHGLMETEGAWCLGRRARGGTYGSRLRDELGYTPVYVRFNTGRRISANGRSLSELLGVLVDQWPEEVEQLALVGHSMGGLVARSACHQAAEAGEDWVRRVRHTITLGSPHMGAPLEQVVCYASAGLCAFPETRPFGNFLRRRSGGIRDLRHGSLVDADWKDRDPDALRAEATQEVPLLEGATHCFVAATITRSPKHPLGRLIGDWLVLEPSASGRSRRRRIPFRSEHGMHLGGTNHFALLNHPDVYAKLREWLSTPPEALDGAPDEVVSAGRPHSGA